MSKQSLRIFVSYSRQDVGFVERLANDLVGNGLSIWRDAGGIEPGQLWDREVQKALEESDCLLIILSPDAMTSENVLDEVSFALNKQKPILPVLYRDCSIPLRLHRFQFVDFQIDYGTAFSSLLKVLSDDGKLHAKGTGLALDSQNLTADKKPDLTGEWLSQAVSISATPQKFHFTFKQQGIRLSGTIRPVGTEGEPMGIEEIKRGIVQGNRISFECSGGWWSGKDQRLMKETFTGVLENGTLHLLYQIGEEHDPVELTVRRVKSDPADPRDARSGTSAG